MATPAATHETSPGFDQRIVLHGVSWEQYEALLALFGDEFPRVRMAYLEGALEIMSPSRTHERIKKTVARLIELYALETGLALTGLGSTTFRRQARERGVEPDECYCVGEEKEYPDLAFEVVLTTGGVNRLAIYEGLGVPEVWFWQMGAFDVYRLTPTEYAGASRSEIVPGLDPALLATLAEELDQTRAVQRLRDILRSGGWPAAPARPVTGAWRPAAPRS